MLIEKIKVIQNPSGPLQSVLPDGLEIAVDNPLVVLVGRNGSGKTGFLRLLKTSLECNLYFEEHGRTLWHSHLGEWGSDSITASASSFFKQYPALRNTHGLLHDREMEIINIFAKEYPGCPIETIQGYNIKGGESDRSAFAISRDDETALRGWIALAGTTDTPLNRFGYLHIASQVPCFYHVFAPPINPLSASKRSTTPNQLDEHFSFRYYPRSFRESPGTK